MDSRTMMKTVFVTLLMIGIAQGQTSMKPLMITECPQDCTCTIYGNGQTVSTCALKPTPAKPSAKKAASDPTLHERQLAYCKEIGGTAVLAKEYGPDVYICATNPLDVPAIRKTVKDEPNCGTSYIAGQADDGWLQDMSVNGMHVCSPQPTFHVELHCPDDDAYAIWVSVSGKNASCHRIVP